MATVRDICTQALQDLMVVGADQSMSATEGTLAFTKLNNLMDQGTTESLLLYSNLRTLLALTPSQAEYTVGDPGGDFEIPRPLYLDFVNYYDTSASDPPAEIPLVPFTDQAWAGITMKELESNLPTNYYYNLTFPLATLSLYPVPTSSTLVLVLYNRQQITEFASLDTTISLPPGWRRYLVSNLAVELAPAFEREPSPTLLRIAQDSKAKLKRSNIRLTDAVLDNGALIGAKRGGYSYWDFLAGSF